MMYLPQFADVKKIVMDDNFWERLSVAVKVLEVVLKALRYSDGMKGGSMGQVFSLLLQIQDLLDQPIAGLNEDIRKKVSHFSMLRQYSTHGNDVFFTRSFAWLMVSIQASNSFGCIFHRVMQVAELFKSRWYAFHTPVMTAAFALHPEFCRREISGILKSELFKCMQDLAKAPGAPGTYAQIKAEYILFVEAINCRKVCAFLLDSCASVNLLLEFCESE